MAKYDWKQLEKEYILSEHKSVAQFIKSKNIPYNGTTKGKTKGWSQKKRLKQDQKATKIIEKTIEKESEKEAQQIVDIKSIANELALNIIKANTQLETYLVRSKEKTKSITYDYDANKPAKEEITEKETIDTMQGIVDRQGLKTLTSALKDLSEILGFDNEEVEDISETDADIYGS